MTLEQLNLEMMSRGLPYDEPYSKQHKMLQILRYDTDHRPSITQPLCPVAPRTLPPNAHAASASVARRPVPQGGLALSILRDYSDNESDAELRHLGLNNTRNTRRNAQELMIINYYEPRHSEAEERRAQENLDTLKQTNFEKKQQRQRRNHHQEALVFQMTCWCCVL